MHTMESDTFLMIVRVYVCKYKHWLHIYLSQDTGFAEHAGVEFGFLLEFHGVGA